jgi:CubicO group peptidase (beta-lactamase class C family)
MVSSARDMARLIEAALAARMGAASAIGVRAIREAWSAPEGVSGYESGTAYGMGWMIIDDGDGRFMFHGGSLENFQSAVYADPASGRGFALLMNQGGLAAQERLTSIQSGLIAMLRGKGAPEPKPRRIPAILSIALGLVAAYEAARFMALRAWAKRRPAKRAHLAVIVAVMELAWAGFLVFGAIPLGNAVSGEIAGWRMIYGLAPELVIIVGLLAVSAAVRASIRIARSFRENRPRR